MINAWTAVSAFALGEASMFHGTRLPVAGIFGSLADARPSEEYRMRRRRFRGSMHLGQLAHRQLQRPPVCAAVLPS